MIWIQSTLLFTLFFDATNHTIHFNNLKEAFDSVGHHRKGPFYTMKSMKAFKWPIDQMTNFDSS